MIKKKNIFVIFLIFLTLHLTIWTLVPAFSNLNLPLDTIEALAWGSNLDWGFSKHPPLSAFVVELFYQIFGNQDWAYYLLSQIFVIITFFSIFKFSEEFFNNKYPAFIAVLLLEGIFFYNHTTPEFNVNVCQLPFWSLSIYFTWRCFKYDKIIDYLFLGIFLGLGILSKYLFVYLIIGIKLFFLYHICKGKKFKLINIFLVGSLVVLILLPHIIWLSENNYSTITYALSRTGAEENFFNHLVNPLIFIIKQAGILTPFLLMSFFLFKKFKLKINIKDEKFIFLFFTIIIPVLFIFLTSLIMGIKIRTMWMTPFYLFFGVFIVYIFQKNIDFLNLKKFYSIFLFFFYFVPRSLSWDFINERLKKN